MQPPCPEILTSGQLPALFCPPDFPLLCFTLSLLRRLVHAHPVFLEQRVAFSLCFGTQALESEIPGFALSCSP